MVSIYQVPEAISKSLDTYFRELDRTYKRVEDFTEYILNALKICKVDDIDN